MRAVRSVLIGFCLVVLVPHPSLAQASSSPDQLRFFVDITLSGVASPLALGRVFTSRAVTFGEIATAHATYPEPSRENLLPLAEAGGGIMLGRHFGVGVIYSRTSYEDVVGLDATVPHPVFLNAPASGLGVSAGTLERKEAAAHVLLVLAPIRTARSEMRLHFGPSFFWYRADMVREVLYTQTFDALTPSNLITINDAASQKVTAATLGFHLGGDLTYFLTHRFGIGGGMRYSRGTVTVEPEPLSRLKQDIRVGNTLYFVSLRVRFSH